MRTSGDEIHVHIEVYKGMLALGVFIMIVRAEVYVGIVI